MRLRTAAAVAVIAGVAAGAAVGFSDPGQKKSPSHAAPAGVAVTDETPYAAEGRDYRIARTLSYDLDGWWSSYSGEAPDGTQFWENNGLAMDDTTEDPRGTAVVLRDPKSGKLTEVSRHGTSDHWVQSLGLAISGDRAVWVETPSTSLYEEPWEMYSYDVSTGRETHLASSDFFGIENPPQPWMEGVVVHVEGDYVYFSAVDEVRESDPDGYGRASVYRVPVTGGDPELVAKGAIGVFSGVDGLLEIRFPDRLVGWDPAKGPDGEIAGTSLPADAGSFANEGVRVAINEGEGLLIEKPDGGQVAIKVDPEASAYYPNATSRWVSFTVDNGEQRGYLYDLQTDKLLRLKGVKNSSTMKLTGNQYDLQVQRSRNPATSFSFIELLPAD